MRIEQLGTESGQLIIGIAELQNSKKLNQKELIQLSASISHDSLTIQFLNGLLIADEIHLLSAAQNAINAQKGEYMLSRSLDVELIVYASAQRQIGKALDALGIFDGLESIAVVVVGIDTGSVKNSIGDLIEKIGPEVVPPFAATNERLIRIKEHYQISDLEIGVLSESDEIESQMKALTRCLVSRISLVAIDS